MSANIKKDFNKPRRPDVTSLIYGKIPPQATELEEAVLGAIMLEREKLSEVLEIIQSPECFYQDAHQKIYEAIQSIHNFGGSVDLHTVTDALRKAGNLEIIGGAYYLAKISMGVVSSAHVEHHARIVMEKFLHRELIRISGNTISKAYDESEDCFELITELEEGLQSMDRMIDNSGQNTTLSSGQSASKVIKYLYDAQDRKEGISGIPTGFVDLDTLTYGWQKTDLILLAARPGQGKTALALHWMLTAAKAKANVLFISMEMSSDQLTKRVIANLGNVDFGHIMSARLSTEELEASRLAGVEFSKLPITLDDKSAINILSLRRRVKRWVEKFKNKKRSDGSEHEFLLIVDYLQLLTVQRMPGMSTNDTVSMKSETLKSIAKDFNMPVIALSQMSRDIEKRKGEPMLSDLRDSGSLEQDANAVIFIHHDKGTELIMPKQRNGDTGRLNVKFIGKYQKFTEVQEWTNEETFKPYSAGIAAAGTKWEDEF